MVVAAGGAGGGGTGGAGAGGAGGAGAAAWVCFNKSYGFLKTECVVMF